jgi:replicative DNA helicase
MNRDRLPPHDLDAERAVIGAMLLAAPSIAGDVFGALVPGDFYNPRHQLIYATMMAQRADGHPIDAVTLSAELRTSSGADVEWLPLLLEAQNSCPSISLAGRYAAVVAEHARRRQIITLASEITERAYALDDASDIIDHAKGRLGEAALRSGGVDVLDNLTTFSEFVMRHQNVKPDWAIPNVLARAERLLIVAPEGMGKAVLMRQIAIAIGGGVHPFTQAKCPQLTTLYVDLENPARTVAHQAELTFRGGRRLLDGANDAWLLHEEAGLDLRTTSAQIYLEKAMQFVQPAILCIGPIYKAARKRANENWSDATLDLLAVLDDLRTRFNCALVMEHHAPKGTAGSRDLVPFGASEWLRWPDYGIRLEPEQTERSGQASQLVVGTFRGSRMEVSWPDVFVRGGDHNLPWVGMARPR